MIRWSLGKFAVNSHHYMQLPAYGANCFIQKCAGLIIQQMKAYVVLLSNTYIACLNHFMYVIYQNFKAQKESFLYPFLHYVP